jgi:hypothetical protein
VLVAWSASALAAAVGVRWDRDDMTSKRWWPQGITTSRGRRRRRLVDGRAVLIDQLVLPDIDGLHKGARLSFVDLTDPERSATGTCSSSSRFLRGGRRSTYAR